MDEWLKCRVGEKERDLLKRVKEATGVSASEYVRRLIRKHAPLAIRTKRAA